MKSVHMLAFALLVIGGINWGLVGLLDFNLVSAVFGFMPGLTRVVEIAVGVSAVYLAATHMGDCRVCGTKSKR